MPPKSQKGGADKNKDVQETEDPLQAVVLADSFETRFHPFTLERPRCLLPLANAPLIEYTLEYLASTGIEEVFVYCSAHPEQIEDYLKSSKWTQPHAPFRLHILRSTSRSIGDAMRDLDKRAILINDFIVVYGDVVSNVPLGPALAAHRARRAVDKNAIMTMVLREAGAHHRTKANDMLPAFVVDPAKRRCLHYQQLATDSEGLLLDADTLSQDVDVRTDLIDCGIDICTPDVLALWSDNFDYEKPRAGFLHSVLKDYELNGKTIHTHIVNDCYAARVRNLQAYDAVSRDILEGWSWPYVPLANWADGMDYERPTPDLVKGAGARGRLWRIGSKVVVGSNSFIGAATSLRHSTIGKDCSIGKNCVLDNAYIWDNVVIEEGCTINKAIIASDARIGSDSTIHEGAMVSYGASLPPKTTLGKRKRAVRKNSTEKDLPIQSFEGFDVLTARDDDEEDDNALGRPFYALNLNASQESISTLDSEISGSEEDAPARRASFTSQSSAEGTVDASGDNFVALNAASICDSLKQRHDVSTIQLELQSQRMAQNASEQQVRHAVASGLIRYIADTNQDGKQVVQLVQRMKSMFERIVFDSAQTKKDDQVDFLLLCQYETAKRARGADIFGSICNGLYTVEDWDNDGVFGDGEAFEQWWEDERSQASDELKKVRNRMEKFIEIVSAQDEDESEDDDDSE